ncbi:probable cytochrome P450 303a1 [Anoplophora glabripennis]|uniref:probable cytochrome P450 303a1 n=1 Tax=Anoplophora glabripennis TaxID=217634 RepID=UPI000874927D|nr:probable cytochrome P450 303a1 [Anoplophora glabripennis]
MWLAVILFIGILGLLVYLDTRKPKKFPPGPKWRPLVGCALETNRLKKKTKSFILATAELSAKYGPVLGLKVGKHKLVVVYGPHAVKEFLTSDDLAGRPFGEFYELRTWGKRRGILLVDQSFWYEQRRFSIRQLREFGFGRRNMSTLIEEETQELVNYILRTIHDKDSLIFEMTTLFNVHVLNTLWRMLAGVRYKHEDDKMKELQAILSELFERVSMVGASFSHFPILKYIAPELSGYNFYIRAHMRIWDFLNRELNYHKKTRDPKEPRDFMDVYLNVLNSSEDIPNSFSEQQLMALCLDMFMAGSETTTNTLGFCFLYLILYPDVQRKAQEEIDSVIGKHCSPSMNDRPNLPYVECVVLEALRMFGGRAFTVPHRALRDTELCGYRIPKDVLVIANLHGSMLSSNSEYEKPMEFMPERYMKNGKIVTPDSFMPFGFGKHRCLGETLARANLFLFVATLLQKFTFSVLPDQRPTEDFRDGVTPGPRPFKAKIVPRS